MRRPSVPHRRTRTSILFNSRRRIGSLTQSLNNGPVVSVTESGVPNTDIALGDTVTGIFHYDDTNLHSGWTQTTPQYVQANYSSEYTAGISITNDRTGQVTQTQWIDATVWDSYDIAARPDAFFVNGSHSNYGPGSYEPHFLSLSFDSASADILNGTAMPGSRLLLLTPREFRFEYNYITDITTTSTVIAAGTISSVTLLPVPEPATYAMLAAGLGLFAWRRRSRS